MITRYESVNLFDSISDEDVSKAISRSNKLYNIIDLINREQDWELPFYDLPLEERRIAFLYGFQKSLNKKRKLVKKFRKAKSAEQIYENIFCVPKYPDEYVEVILFDDHIHFLFDTNIRERFKLPEKQGRLVSFLSDKENLSEYGRKFKGTLSIIDINYPDSNEGAYHERYHGLTYEMPLSQTFEIAGRYWEKLRDKKLELNVQNISDFYMLKQLSAHVESNATYCASNYVDYDKLYGDPFKKIFETLRLFYPEYIENEWTVQGAPSRLLGSVTKIYSRISNIFFRLNGADKKKVLLYSELLMYNELEKLHELID